MTIHANQSQSEDHKFGGETLDPYENLAQAIILQAAKDYRLTDDECELAEIERFFRSGWFGVLSKVDPEYLIKKLRKEKQNDCKGIFITGTDAGYADKIQAPADRVLKRTGHIVHRCLQRYAT